MSATVRFTKAELEVIEDALIKYETLDFDGDDDEAQRQYDAAESAQAKVALRISRMQRR